MVFKVDGIRERLSDATKRRLEACRKRQSSEFIRGPIPKSWIIEAAKAGGSKALNVALALWFQAGLERSRTFRLRPSRIREFLVCRETCYRTLTALESAGLIAIARRRGRSPEITILEAKHATDQGAS